MADNVYAQRVEEIRKMGYDAVIITGTDPHSSEYPAPRWKQVEWVSGFTGEAGDLVITQYHAGLWTDSRYFIQANQQLAGTGIELHKTRVPEEVSIPDWLAGQFTNKPVRIAIDGLSQSVEAVNQLDTTLRKAYGLGGYEIVDLPDMLDKFWSDRPAIPHTPVTWIDEKSVGETRREKLAWLRGEIKKAGCDSVFLTALDEIAWLLNVRGQDIDYNPYVISNLLVTPQRAIWLVRNVDEVPTVPEVACAGYAVLEDALLENKEECGRLFTDPSTLNWHTYKAVRKNLGDEHVVFGTSPVIVRKAVKNKKASSAGSRPRSRMAPRLPNAMPPKNWTSSARESRATVATASRRSRLTDPMRHCHIIARRLRIRPYSSPVAFIW